MKQTAWFLTLVLVLLGTVVAGAADERPRWEFEALPYVWLPGNFGTVGVKGRTAFVDVTVHDVLDIATDGNALTGTGYFSLAYDRWSAFIDAFGGYVEESTVQKIPTRFCTLCVAAKAEIRPVFVDFALGYRVGQWALPGRPRPATLGVYAGTRYMHFGAKLSGSVGVAGGFQGAGNVSEAFNWADPLIGVRWEVPLLARLSLDLRADIGGFGVSSELIWGLVGGVRYWLSWNPLGARTWLGAGYRAVSFDRDFGDGGNLTLDFRGPYGGMGFAF